ncbi:hypothetical protein V3851_02900 [Paenibacillus sp. M1]|uniref:Uncharacterized protein n=2 Tax=Paenibacillus haidiansis TaxID=1574488 RepID=A0ABU7VLW7_9BACL
MLRRTMLYGILLVAGVTLGMQMSEPGPVETGLEQNGSWTPAAGAGWPNYNPYSGAAQPSYGNPAGQTGNNGMVWYGNGYGAQGVTPGGTVNGVPGGIQGGYNAAGNGTMYDDSYYYGQMSGETTQTPADLLLPQPESPAVDRFADKTAQLLQQVSRKSIHWFASWFGPSPE